MNMRLNGKPDLSISDWYTWLCWGNMPKTNESIFKVWEEVVCPGCRLLPENCVCHLK